MPFKSLSPWIMVDHCATRVVKGGNPLILTDRVCFIEKTPRVRVNCYGYCLDGGRGLDEDIWLYGPKGDGQLCGLDEKSRAWCDSMLVLLGWE